MKIENWVINLAYSLNKCNDKNDKFYNCSQNQIECRISEIRGNIKLNMKYTFDPGI